MTATLTLYCDAVDGLLRPCLAQYTAATANLDVALMQAAGRGWTNDGRHDRCPGHREELP